MPRGDFKERQFTCSICGERFSALTRDQPVIDPVCTHCGLRYSPAQRRRLTDKRKRKHSR